MAKKLLDQIRDAIHLKNYSYRTEESYMDWARRFILFHNKRQPKDMGTAEINAILTHLATQRSVAAGEGGWLHALVGRRLRLRKAEPSLTPRYLASSRFTQVGVVVLAS